MYQFHYLRTRIDVQKPYKQDVVVNGIQLDYVFETNEYESRYIVLKLFDRPNERCGKEDYCWEVTGEEKNVKLVQIQTLDQV